MKGFGIDDSGNPAPLSGFTEHKNREYDDPADDVRLAIHQCSPSDGDTKAAYHRLALAAHEDGMDPQEMLSNFDKIDAASWQNPNIAVSLVNGYAQKPKYVQPEKTEPRNEFENCYEAALAASKSAISTPDYKKVEPHLANLAHRNGSAVDAIDNMLNLRQQALSGNPQLVQQARQTAYGHYLKGVGVNPDDYNTTRDVAQATRVFKDLNTNPELRRAVSEEIAQNGHTYPDRDDNDRPVDGVTMVALARAQVLRNWRNG